MENSVFVMTGDKPIAETSLKRLVVQHQSIGFSHIEDKAIVNDGEVFEDFGSMTTVWGDRGHYPRVDDYDDLYHDLIKGLGNLTNRRIVNLIRSSDVKSIDPASYWIAHNAALSQKSLVRSAAIDATDSKLPFSLPNTIVSGGGFAPSGLKSKHEVPYRPRVTFEDISDDWLTIANLRVGRALKAIRVAQAIRATPIAVDSINTNISLEYLTSNSSVYKQHSSIIDFSFEYSVIDNDKLEGVLKDASWEDVLHIRKKTLPILAQTKSLISKKMNKMDQYDNKSPEELINFVTNLHHEFLNLKEREYEAWEALRIGSVLKAGGTVGAAVGAWNLGSAIIPMTMGVTESITSLLATGLVASAAMKDELQALIPARRKLKEHPLFILDGCKSLPLSEIAIQSV
ncbi:TPA: hypothetical protein ACGU7T_002664 [Vibrio vulnificus]|uniref:hypothetical protein n=1 Tax=Vibrio vulnificus TaxID=672 RepID=UPI001A1B4AE7|nr:hypothetical protein [Vibrio vulnificus]ELV8742188.1 hypothetical protein [Vibrio vulnificus]MCG6296761.1 hypothetical protein [Vibrio vulnificus]HAS6324754.1 hypothetical protein [Vibrio vulnificus]HAT8521313.1 hypothetical protein [Vibrio vulnificus]HDY7550174.1 hypothetical protein [Vibrio vulnificus]